MSTRQENPEGWAKRSLTLRWQELKATPVGNKVISAQVHSPKRGGPVWEETCKPSTDSKMYSSGFPWFCCVITHLMGFPRWLSGEESTYNAGDPGTIPRLERSPGEGHDNPLQCSCLENPMDRGAWRATAHEVTKSQTQLTHTLTHTHTHTHTHIQHTS